MINIKADINDDGSCEGSFTVQTAAGGYELVVVNLLAIDFKAFMDNARDIIADHRANLLRLQG